MTRSEFLKPYLMLVIQPWGRRYGLQTPEGEVQSDLYFKRLNPTNPYVWEGICELFAQGDHWPSIDEIKFAVRHNSREETPKQLPAPVEIADDDYPPKLAYEYSKAQNCSFRDACLKVLPRWLEAHPRHEHYARANALLKTMQEKPIIPRRVVHALQADDPYEFVTDAKAEGLKRCQCAHCNVKEKQVFICWCQKWEGCKSCYVGHEAGCQGAESVFVRRKGRKSA